MDVHALLDALRALETDQSVDAIDGYISRTRPVVLDAEDLAVSVLILPNGQCNWDAIHALREHGFDVFPVEKDRYGWLIGGIVTRVGILTYG